MSIAVRAGTSKGDLASAPHPLVITKPTGWAATDYFILCVGQSGAAGAYTAATDWTLIGQVLSAGSNIVTGQVFGAFGSTSNLSFTHTGNNANTAGWLCTAFTGVDQTTPVDVTGTPGSVAGTSLAASSLTIVTAGAIKVISVFDYWCGTMSASGMTGVANAANFSSVINESAALLYDLTSLATGATGTTTVSDSDSTAGQELIVVPFALRPATSGTAYSKTVNESLGATDSLTRSLAFARSFAEALGATDTISRAAGFNRSLSEAMGSTDAMASLRALIRTITDSAGAADSIFAARQILRSLSDSSGATDVAGHASAILRAVDDGMGVSDAVARASIYLRTITDHEGIADNIPHAAQLSAAIWLLLNASGDHL